MNKNIEELKTLYARKSKHSSYQILSQKLALIIREDEIEVKTRFESERLKYILNNVKIKGKSILDIGGNTGYFSFELIDHGAQKLHYYEGNKAHTDFVRLASSALGVSDKIQVNNKYLNFENKLNNEQYDITLLLNVLHHLGDDYGDKELTIEMAKKNILTQLNSFADITSILIFQLGFNWKGNRNKCLFENGTKKEMINYIKNGTKKYWNIKAIGISEKTGNIIKYEDLDDNNITRKDSLGEFLNRPIFILEKI